MDSAYLTISHVRIIHDTSKAFLCRVRDTDYWIPKSQIASDRPHGRGYEGPLMVSAWWLETTELEHLTSAGPSAPQQSGVDVLITAQRIYRRLAAKYHPDRSPETAEAMKDINELWQAVLSDLRNSR